MTVQSSTINFRALKIQFIVLLGGASIALSLFFPRLFQGDRIFHHHPKNTSLVSELPDLAIQDGDPYIRALMLTISASESNHKNGYYLLYGGDHVHDLSQHPDQCLIIPVGPNRGDCSTAAGRYQFLTSTWQEKAALYHPAPEWNDEGVSYSFAPEYQDQVMHDWLRDPYGWEVDILALLQEDRVEEALAELSGVWTSLGGGIEENTVTPYLPRLYRQFLANELEASQNVAMN